jgi:hypothetical protein
MPSWSVAGVCHASNARQLPIVELRAYPIFSETLRMTDDIIKVDLIGPDGTAHEAELLLWEEDPADKDKVRLSLRIMGREIERSEGDFFSAMCQIRRELEDNHLLLKCYGASRTVFPSPMSKGMGYGSMAYKLYPGRPARQDDLVCIFDTGPDVSPASVDDQEKYYQEWLNSLK